MKKTISREAGDKSKGFRLQKLRAIALILDAIENSEEAHIFATTEFLEDVYLKKSIDDNFKDYFEENKNYEKSPPFTFNSETILNTIISFIDIYINFKFSPNLYFGFYTNNTFSKERITNRIDTLSLTLPDKPILELLSTKNLDHPDLITFLSKIIIDEYKEQYNKHNLDGHIDVITKFDEKDWKSFFKMIDWKFGEINHEELKDKLLCKIKKCRYYSPHLEDLEDSILSTILEVFDVAQNKSDPTQKFVYAIDIKDIFSQAIIRSKGLIKNQDPTWILWKKLAPPTDNRNLSDKILDFSQSFDKRKIECLARKVSMNKVEEIRFKNDKSFYSLKYRIFVKCEEELLNILNNLEKDEEITPTLIESWIEKLKDSSNLIIKDLSVDYSYTLKNESTLEGIILELFDSCFLAFDWNNYERN